MRGTAMTRQCSSRSMMPGAATGPLQSQPYLVPFLSRQFSRELLASPRSRHVVDLGERGLLAAPLEKGVLLRSRVVAAIGPERNDEAWADRVLQTFAASPPPLAT